MEVLNLIIKQEYFDLIMTGEKKQEFREIKPTTASKYILFDEEGYDLEDENGNAVPRHYDAIRFFVGYKKDRDTALVEVTGIYTEVFVDENNEIITYEHNGDIWWAQQVVFNLGRILESKTKKQY